MTWHTAPENDYRGAARLPAGDRPTVGLIIPVYNRVELLRNTLAGIIAQTYPSDLTEVIVVDDGSDEDVTRAVAESADRLRLTVTRQEHDGYGAGRARNRGAARTSAEVLVFIDADCIPTPELVAHHVQWHRRAANLVVVGARHHIDASGIDRESLAAGAIDLRSRVRSGTDPAADSDAPDDWRKLFYRRTAKLRVGDEVFRSLVSSNFSVRRDRFLEVGGFAEDFRRWGGEDTELGWRLFNAGMMFVPENQATVYHQIQGASDDSGDWRAEARAANDGIIQTKIPHRFYRKSARGYIYETPKVSWLVSPSVGSRIEALWGQMLRQSLTDFEVIVVGDDAATERLGELLQADPRFTIVSPRGSPGTGFRRALRAARGEYVAILHGWASLDHRLLARAVRRLDAHPRSSVLRCGYQIITASGATEYIYEAAVDDIDAAWGGDGLPVFAISRRRDWAKLLHGEVPPSELWGQMQALAGTRYIRDAMVALPALTPDVPMPVHFPAVTGERSLLVDDVTKGGAKKAARALTRYATAKVRRRPYRPAGLAAAPGELPPGKTQEAPARPGITYIGWLGRENLGDEAMLHAVQQLFPDAAVGYEVGDQRLLMLGGGTLINRKSYLEALQRHDSPRLERVVFGSGVADPAIWGVTEPVAGWLDFLDSCRLVGVRGPRSETILRDWGYTGPLEIIGDPALALTPPPDVDRRDGLVVVSPAWTRGELWGGDDAAVYAALADLIVKARRSGREIAMLSCHPSDDRYIMDIMAQARAPDLEYVAGYADEGAALRLLAAADAVVAERLHAAVLGAACETQFIGVEYRSKMRDFARSVGWEDYVVRTDSISGDMLLDRLESLDPDDGSLSAAVGELRHRLAGAAERIWRGIGAH